MKVVVLFDGISALGKSPDLAILETVEAVEAVLAADGHEPIRIPVNPDGRWIERVRRAKPDLAFNLCEGIDGVAVSRVHPSSLRSSCSAFPTRAAAAWTTSICLRKHVVNTLLDAAHLPVPRFGVARSGSRCHPSATRRSVSRRRKTRRSASSSARS